MCQLSPAQEEDTAIVSDTTDDLWFLTEGESEQVSVEMKEAALEEGRGGEGEACSEEDDRAGKEEKGDREVCAVKPETFRPGVMWLQSLELPVLIVLHII